MSLEEQFNAASKYITSQKEFKIDNDTQLKVNILLIKQIYIF